MNPRTGLPAAIRASLTSVMIEAAVGVDALSRVYQHAFFVPFDKTHLVPSTMSSVPFQTITNFVA